MAKIPITALVEAARAGGPDEIETLLRAMWPDAYRLARAILGEDGPAEDAAQEASIIVYRTIASLRSSAAFRTWLYRIVVRECSEIRRRRTRTEPPAVAAVPVDRDGALDVWRALAVLSPHLRDVVVLRYFEDLSSREIASVLRIPDGTVRFRLMVARQRLKPLLHDDEDFVPPRVAEVRTHAV